MRRLRTYLLVPTVLVMIGGVNIAAASAAPPSNDREAGAIRIGSLPFTHSTDTSAATTDGPRFCDRPLNSVFYSFEPDHDVRIQIDLIGSEYAAELSVYTRSGSGGVERVRCDYGRFAGEAGVRFGAKAGVTYFVMATDCCNQGGGELTLTADTVSDVELDYSVQVTGGSADPATGMATLFGTLTCNERSAFAREGTLRQVRQGGVFVARGYFYFEAPCVPGTPTSWSAEVDTDTGIAFSSGPALMQRMDEFATDGWRDDVYVDVLPDNSITIQ